MEIIFGMRQAPRELTIHLNEASDKTTTKITNALEQGSGLINLTDQNGDVYLIPVPAINYVQIGTTGTRRVGFGS
ncbi:MAG: DUF3107 domain-containing protein [Micrococcales bacterium]|nr:DUF3107 domain-containing protein [Micrococcales bacterium]